MAQIQDPTNTGIRMQRYTHPEIARLAEADKFYFENVKPRLEQLALENEERQEELRRENIVQFPRRQANPSKYLAFLNEASNRGLIGSRLEFGYDQKKALLKLNFAKQYYSQHLEQASPEHLGAVFNHLVKYSRRYQRR